MSNEIFNKKMLHDWINRSIEKLDIKTPQSIHIDDLFNFSNAAMEKSLLIEVINRCLQEMIEYISNRTQDIMILVVLPLSYVESLDTYVPSLREIFEDPMDEPPSLYLIIRDAEKYYEIVEEYRHAIEAKQLNILVDDICCYYRCFRNREFLQNGWEEYSRAIYLEHYPPNLQID